MTNLDEIEIAQTFKSRIDLGERDKKYADVEWVALDDKNAGNYKQDIHFDTTDMKDRLPVYRESYIVLPLKVTSGGTAYTANTRLAFKCSILSLIRSILVQPIGSGPVLVNEHDGGLPLMNNLRLLTESDIDWVECSGEELHFFGADRALPLNVMGSPLVRSVDGAQSRVAAYAPNNTISDNPTLADRVAVFMANADHNTATATAAEFKTIVSIPLKFIHSFFDQLGFALPNYPMRFKLGLSSLTNGNHDFMPITTPRSGVVATVDPAGNALVPQAPIAAVDAPKLEIDKSIDYRGFAPGACRLYVKCVVLKPEDRKKLDDELSSGFKKTLTYLTTDIFMKGGVATSALGSGFHHVFAENVKRPVRVWAMFPPQNSLTSKDSTFPATIGPVRTDLVQLKINNSEFRKRPFESQLELYNELRQYQLGSGYATQQGARISYNDFCHGMNPILFDVSRHPTVLNNLPITFTFDGKLVNSAATPCDAIFLVERYRTAVINVTKSSAKTDVEDGLGSASD